MGRRIVGIEVEKRRALVFSWGYVGVGSCTTDPEDCCDNFGTASPVDCCSGLPVTPTLEFDFFGPFRAGCLDHNFTGTLTQQAGILQWTVQQTTLIVEGESVFLQMVLYCVEEAWRAAGVIGRTGASAILFDVPLSGETTLVGSVEVAGCESLGTIEIEHPCPAGTGTGTGTELPPEPPPVAKACCPELIPGRLYFSATGALAELGTVVLDYDSGLGFWRGSGSGCGGTVTIDFRCAGHTTFGLTLSGDTSLSDLQPADSCSPFLWMDTVTIVSGGCSGNSTITIDESA